MPRAVPSKDQLLNDLSNTAIGAALISGFSLANFQLAHRGGDVPAFKRACLTCMYLATHMCTFSLLASGLLFRHVNLLEDQPAHAFAKASYWALRVPFYSFGLGVIFYIVGVIFVALDQEDTTYVFGHGTKDAACYSVFYVLLGVMCIGMVMFYIVWTERVSTRTSSETIVAEGAAPAPQHSRTRNVLSGNIMRRRRVPAVGPAEDVPAVDAQVESVRKFAPAEEDRYDNVQMVRKVLKDELLAVLEMLKTDCNIVGEERTAAA